MCGVQLAYNAAQLRQTALETHKRAGVSVLYLGTSRLLLSFSHRRRTASSITDESRRRVNIHSPANENEIKERWKDWKAKNEERKGGL
jgi:hypothetical protein